MRLLNQKAYGSIPHVYGHSSHVGPLDKTISEGQTRIALRMPRDEHDKIIVQEKLDGSCVAVAKIDGALHCLTRKGNQCVHSPYEMHHLFVNWVFERYEKFNSLLREGERLVGEWLAQAHSTVYVPFPKWEPFVAFDLMTGVIRTPFNEFVDRLERRFHIPPLISEGPACSLTRAQLLTHGGQSQYSSEASGTEAEGFIWRVERKGVVEFLCKWVRPDHVPGKLLPGLRESEVTEPVWNWRPDHE